MIIRLLSARPRFFELGFLTRGFVRNDIRQHSKSVNLRRASTERIKGTNSSRIILQGIGFMYQQHKVLVEIDSAGNLEGKPAEVSDLCYTSQTLTLIPLKRGPDNSIEC